MIAVDSGHRPSFHPS